MGDFIQVLLLTLSGISSAIFDVFFALSVLMAWMVFVRLRFFSSMPKVPGLFVKDLLVEHIVQAIVIGIVFSLLVVGLGLPIEYSVYLFYLLPMAYIMGLLHIRYADLKYAGALLMVISLVLKGQIFLGLTLPSVDIDGHGLILVIGILSLLQGLLLVLTAKKPLLPIVVSKDQNKYLVFVKQHVWPIPLVVLASMALSQVAGESVPMPSWWPLGLTGIENLGFFVLPMITILTYGSVVVSEEPVIHCRKEGYRHMVSGISLTLLGWLGLRMTWPTVFALIILLALLILAYLVERKDQKGQLKYRLHVSRGEAIDDRDGICILYVRPHSEGHVLGIQQGSRLMAINGMAVSSVEDVAMFGQQRILDLLIKSVKDEEKGYQVKTSLAALGLSLYDDKEEKVYPFDQVRRLNILNVVMRHKV